MIRYADDLLILCRTREEATEALHDLRVALACVRLRLAEEKTSIHHVDTPFRFLGYRIAGGRAVAAPARIIVAGRQRRGNGTTHRQVPRHTDPRRGGNGNWQPGNRRQGEDMVGERGRGRRRMWQGDEGADDRG